MKNGHFLRLFHSCWLHNQNAVRRTDAWCILSMTYSINAYPISVNSLLCHSDMGRKMKIPLNNDPFWPCSVSSSSTKLKKNKTKVRYLYYLNSTIVQHTIDRCWKVWACVAIFFMWKNGSFEIKWFLNLNGLIYQQDCMPTLVHYYSCPTVWYIKLKCSFNPYPDRELERISEKSEIYPLPKKTSSVYLNNQQ